MLKWWAPVGIGLQGAQVRGSCVCSGIGVLQLLLQRSGLRGGCLGLPRMRARLRIQLALQGFCALHGRRDLAAHTCPHLRTRMPC